MWWNTTKNDKSLIIRKWLLSTTISFSSLGPAQHPFTVGFKHLHIWKPEGWIKVNWLRDQIRLKAAVYRFIIITTNPSELWAFMSKMLISKVNSVPAPFSYRQEDRIINSCGLVAKRLGKTAWKYVKFFIK